MGASAQPRERALNAAAGAMSAAGTCALFNPIDTLKVRWQAVDVRATRATFGAHAARIIAREGLVRGLWAPGLGPNVAFLGAMSSLKIGIYAPCRDALVAASGADGKTAATMFAAGLAAGSISYFVTAPLLLTAHPLTTARRRRRAPRATCSACSMSNRSRCSRRTAQARACLSATRGVQTTSRQPAHGQALTGASHAPESALTEDAIFHTIKSIYSIAEFSRARRPSAA